jgi:hypothetical protein
MRVWTDERYTHMEISTGTLPGILSFVIESRKLNPKRIERLGKVLEDSWELVRHVVSGKLGDDEPRKRKGQSRGDT